MEDWKTLQPDQIRLINKHFTPGRGGQKIQHVTIHHMGGIGDTNQCWQWWQTRAASAHYAISRTDRKSTRLNSSHWNKSRMPSSA